RTFGGRAGKTREPLVARRREMLPRTAKSCGPAASTAASSSAEACRPNRAQARLHPLDDGDKKARSPGRARRKPLKPLRAGMSGESGWTHGDDARVLTTISHARLRVQ